MYVDYSGWNEKEGAFCHKIFVDETRTDYEIKFADGSVSKQAGPFETVTADWNNDGDVYTQFGAIFDRIRSDGSSYGRDWYTPVDMVSMLIEGLNPESREYPSNKVIDIPGIEIPGKKKNTIENEKVSESIFINKTEDDCWECSLEKGENSILLVEEKDYPVDLYYTRFDINGSSVVEMDACKNREELMEALNWHGECNHLIRSVWDFDSETCSDDKIIEFFHDVYGSAMKTLSKAMDDMLEYEDCEGEFFEYIEEEIEYAEECEKPGLDELLGDAKEKSQSKESRGVSKEMAPWEK